MNIKLVVITYVVAFMSLNAQESDSSLTIYSDDFEAGKKSWKAVGAKTIAQKAKGNIYGIEDGLVLSDQDVEGHGGWYMINKIILPKRADLTKPIKITTHETYKIEGKQPMRQTISFYDAEGKRINQEHRLLKGVDEAWEKKELTENIWEIDLPDEARSLDIAFISGGPKETVGQYVVDKIGVGVVIEPQQYEIGDVLSKTEWKFDKPSATRVDAPKYWEFAGPMPYQATWNAPGKNSADGYIQIDDKDSRSHGMWVSARTDIANGSSFIDLNLNLQLEELEGEWKIIVAFYKHDTQQTNYSPLIYRYDGLLNVVDDKLLITWVGHDEKHQDIIEKELYRLTDPNSWLEVGQMLEVPHNAKAFRIGVLSGWDPSPTGLLKVREASVTFYEK